MGQRLCHDRISGSVAARRFLRKIIMVGKSCNCFTIEATYACGLLMEGGVRRRGKREGGRTRKWRAFRRKFMVLLLCVGYDFFFNY